MTLTFVALLVRLLAAAVASLSFSILFHVPRRHLPIVTVCATLTYFIFYVVLELHGSNFSAALISTLFTALFAGFAARTRRAPTIVFLITCIIPTVPGASLYNTMHHAISGNWEAATTHLRVALEISLGIAGGILLVSALFNMVLDYLAKRKAAVQDTATASSKVQKPDADNVTK